MQYALLIYAPENIRDGLSDEESQTVIGEYAALFKAPGIVGGCPARMRWASSPA